LPSTGRQGVAAYIMIRGRSKRFKSKKIRMISTRERKKSIDPARKAKICTVKEAEKPTVSVRSLQWRTRVLRFLTQERTHPTSIVTRSDSQVRVKKKRPGKSPLLVASTLLDLKSQRKRGEKFRLKGRLVK